MASVGIALLLTYRLGATEYADAYVMARRLTTSLTELLHRFMLTAMIPILAVGMFAGGTLHPKVLARWTWRLLVAGLLLLGAVWLLAPTVIELLGSHMPEGTREISLWATRLMVLSIPFVVLANLYTSVLYLNGVFGIPSLLKQVPRLLILVVFAIAAQAVLVPAASTAFTVGNVLLLLGCVLLVQRLKKASVTKARPPVEKPKSAASVWAVLLIVAAAQIASWMEIHFSVQLGEGALTILELSHRIGTLIAGAFTVAAVMPYLAKWSKGVEYRTPQSFGQVIWAGMFLLIGVQGFFVLNAQEVVQLLFGNSRLTDAERATMSAVVAAVAISPLAVYLNQILVIWNIAAGRRLLVATVLISVAANLCLRFVLATEFLDTLGLQALTLGMALGPLAAALVIFTFGDRTCLPKQLPWAEARRTGLACAMVLGGMATGRMLAAAMAPELGVTLQAGLSLTCSALVGGGILTFLVWRYSLIKYLRS